MKVAYLVASTIGAGCIAGCSGSSPPGSHDSGISLDSSTPTDSGAAPDSTLIDSGVVPDTGTEVVSDSAAMDAAGACTLDGGGAGSLCSGACVDTQTDPMNCGGCGISGTSVSCEAGSICAMGHCQDIVGSLEGLRWNLPCSMATTSTTCPAVDATPQMTTVHGTSGVIYDVTLRFRGVVEQKTYDGVPDGGVAAVGTNAAFFVAGGMPGGDGYNVYTLAILGPEANILPSKYYLNSGMSGIAHCWPIDYTVTLPMEAASTITLTAVTTDGEEITNQDTTNTPIIIPGISPYPSAYNGQFVQMDIVSVAPAP
jgi:hypothetical protein